jgi:hypothetical protein
VKKKNKVRNSSMGSARPCNRMLLRMSATACPIARRVSGARP